MTEATVYHGCGHYVIRAVIDFDDRTEISESWRYEPSWRHAANRRLCEMSGVDESGCILPPPDGWQMNRTPVSWWRSQ